MKIELRRRAVAGTDPINLHDKLIEGLNQAPAGFWNGNQVEEPDFSTGLECQINLGAGLPDEIFGYVSYVYRDENYLRDTSEFDDRLILNLESKNFELLDQFALVYLPALIRFFMPYRAIFNIDEDLALDDWDCAIELGNRKGLDADGRDDVVRIWPISFYDHELCEKAFGLRPGEVFERLSGRGQKVEIINGGIFIVWSSRSDLSREKIIEIDLEIRSLLGGK